ncbi:hypothetical protein IAU60_005035 [Kwoniella sp. DSM 27419]
MIASNLLYLLPLLSFASAGPSRDTQELYRAASRRDLIAKGIASRSDAQDSHGHGHFSSSIFNSHGHGHAGPSRRNLHARSHGGVLEQKLVRRKKDKKTKRKTCKAQTSTATFPSAAPTATTADSESSIPAVDNAARPTTASAGSDDMTTSSAAAPWGNVSPSSSAADWEASATATSSSAAPAETSSTSGESTGTSDLFPWGTGTAHWSTANGGMSFSDALTPLTAGRMPSTGNAPDGSNALVANYPAGTVGLSSAGFSFYTEGARDGVQCDGAKEVSFSYSVYMNDGFQFVKGGKMPGLYGGTSLSQAKSCSGGRQEGRDSCFSARLMWRTNGAGEIYDYLPVPYTTTDTGYGESIQRGAYTWATGRWTTVAMRVKLNDIGQANGEQELFVDGQSVISLKDVTFATSEGTKIYGIMAQTFFGGHTDDWASPVDQNIWFKDWSLAVLA